MAPFVEHKGRCLELIDPKPFSKSIAHCLAEYRLDRVDELWDISDWIYLIFDGVEKNFQDIPSTLKQVWLPILRRTNFGPLNRIWPWTLKGNLHQFDQLNCMNFFHYFNCDRGRISSRQPMAYRSQRYFNVSDDFKIK